jgi:chromosome partitioning protein
MIILLATQKGGSGKTTLAINIACYLHEKSKTLVIDADKQATLSKTKFNTTLQIKKHYNNIKKLIIDYSKQYKNIVIDTAGRDCAELRSALLVADIVVIPFLVSQPDLYTVKNVDSIVKEAKKYNPKLIAYAVTNCASTYYRNKDAEDAKRFIKANSRLTIIKTVLHSRAAYKEMYTAGKAIIKLQNTKAKQELKSFFKEINI